MMAKTRHFYPSIADIGLSLIKIFTFTLHHVIHNSYTSLQNLLTDLTYIVVCMFSCM